MIDMSALREKPTLSGDHVRLVPLAEEHAEALYESTQDPETRRLMGTHRIFTLGEVREWCAERAAQPDRLDLAIIEQAGDRHLGELSLMDVDRYNESAAYRIALSAIEFTGRGLGREATRLLLEYAFERIGLHRVSLEVYAFNMRAIAAYRACGFAVEGRLRDALLWEGRRHDALVMSVLERDFRRAMGPFPGRGGARSAADHG
ncbi:RimJ/RimL family protein N-acetyltransferase [Spinactinospora alkalitolerans]|uniref:RimJ/RimL family protein N-acetyltransferase n=1 Tax=Spinactinospora alkalitolerans TaxID=687207 RepID=A0A852TS16_9ACTN|nr:GNAT family protein [Spinactinospora alkalitolerans]NYE46809.1 RimJ/RimL family protein N-acetyltransferase [Spinactinospora alkalitolerans]